MDKLLPCPFCGGRSIMVKTQKCGRYVGCLDCGARTEEAETDYAGSARDKAITAWNRRAQPEITGETSDGYHTFNELYHHRAVLFSVICNDSPTRAWKSKLHHDGTMYDGMFIVGIETPDGQATYHYDIEPYWGMFCVPELPQAPEWDGHTPAQAIKCIGKLSAQPVNKPIDAVPVVRGEWILVGTNEHHYETSVEEKCSLCGRYVCRYDTQPQDNYCPNCGSYNGGDKA